MIQTKFSTPEEIEKILKPLETSEAIKEASRLLAPAEAYVHWFKDSGRDKLIAEQSNVVEARIIDSGGKLVEAKINRKARTSDEYREADRLYREALEAKIFLRGYMAGLSMDHESQIVEQKRTIAEIGKGIYEKGS